MEHWQQPFNSDVAQNWNLCAGSKIKKWKKKNKEKFLQKREVREVKERSDTPAVVVSEEKVSDAIKGSEPDNMFLTSLLISWYGPTLDSNIRSSRIKANL